MFVDTHVHLHFPDFLEDQEDVMKRAQENGVSTFINVGTDVPTSEECIELSEKHESIYATAGIHPHDVKDATPENMKRIEELLAHPRVVALGEVGLDFFREHSPHDLQVEKLYEFFEIYKRVRKPLVIHCRDAYDAFLDVLEKVGESSYRGVMHCYSSDKKDMEKFLDYDFYISFAGPLTYKKNDELREACRACPMDRLLLETDAPFLPPQSWRGKRNETSYMLETAKRAAEIKGISLKELAAQTTENAKRLFGL